MSVRNEQDRTEHDAERGGGGLSGIAVRRPVFTVMVTLGILVLGLTGFLRLGTDLFPDVSFPLVNVTVPYPGASPSEVEALVSKVVEDSVVSLNGIDRVRTYSREGLSTTVIFFKLGADITEASTQVRERVSQIRFKLPTDTKEPIISRLDVSAAPIMSYTLRGDVALPALRKYAVDVLKPALEQVDGVASIDVKGGADREIRVELDRARVDALGLDAGAIVASLRMANLTVPAGHYDEGSREVSVRTLGELPSVDAVREVIVAAARDGSAVRLRDVARVEDGYADVHTRVRVNGEEAVTFEVLKQSGENTVAVSDRVKARLAELEKSFPASYTAGVVTDQSRFIVTNVDEVERAIVFGGAMAILIILLFMLDLRSTLISAVALPTSVVGTFFAMYVLGYTLNMMTLMALSLAIGLLIDDAVVVRENIFKHMERGKDPWRAALDGTKEISLSVLATTLTIVAVFLPVSFVKGMVGQFFRQFGLTISCAVVLSLFVAFTLDPMLSSRFSKRLDDKSDRFDALKRPFNAFFQGLDRSYRALLEWSVRHKLLVGFAAFASLGLMAFIAVLMGNDFVNPEDRGQFVLELELPAGTSLDETARAAAPVERRMLEHPDFTMVFATIGLNGESNRIQYRIITRPKQERPAVTLAALKDVARQAAAGLAGAKVSINDPPFVEGAPAEAPIMIDVRGNTFEEIESAANGLAHLLETTPGVDDVQVKYSSGRPELVVMIDRSRAADQGLPVAGLAMALRTSMEGEEAGKLRQGKDEIPIRVRLAKGDRASADALQHLTLRTPKGPVELGDVAALTRAEGPQVIEREDRNRQIQVWASMRGRPLGDIVRELEPRIAELGLPKDVHLAYDGQIRMMNETNENMGLAMLLGVVFIYIVLASQFESFIHPITIMLTLPLALVGAVLALFLTGNTMAMGALIGIILLMGLVTKNAILLIDRAIVRVREQGEPPLQAVLEAGPERLRPILMTSAAMVLGMLPTAINQGEGSEFRAPMAIAIIGGVISSTLLSLIVVPVFYLAIEGLKGRLAGALAPATASRAAIAEDPPSGA
jgi:hydrophobe/amphiphile efflux-1 (HAE1) family protein